MPQPIRKTLHVNFGHQHLKMRPDHMIMIALISHEWALTEITIFEAFIQLSGGDRTWTINATIFETLESLSLRLDIVGKLIRMQAPTFSDEFERVIRPKVRKAAGERNTVIHGKWGTSTDFPQDLVLVQMTSDAIRYTLNDLEQIQERLLDANRLFGDFFIRLTAAINLAGDSI